MPGFNNTYCEFPDVKAEFRKGRRTRDQIANICQITEKTGIPEKYLLVFQTTLTTLCGSQKTGKF